MRQIGGLFDLSGRVAIVTEATGVLGGAMSRELAVAGARVGILGRREERAKNVAEEIVDSGAEALALAAVEIEREQLEGVREATLERWGRVDILTSMRNRKTLGVRFLALLSQDEVRQLEVVRA